MLRTMRLILLFLFSIVQIQAGIIEEVTCYELPYLEKTIYFFAEEHTDDSFDPDAVAQRDEIAGYFEDISDAHAGTISCYLESNEVSRTITMQQSHAYTYDVSAQGDFFEQFYIPLAYADGQEVMHGNLQLSTFDIRDAVYCACEHDLTMLADDHTHDINWFKLREWVRDVDDKLNSIFSELQSHYPKKFISYLKRDMNRKKKRVIKTIDLCAKKKTRYYDRALDDFYDYSDLLADFTILHKLATDSNEAVVVHAGSAHVETLMRYLDLLPV